MISDSDFGISGRFIFLKGKYALYESKKVLYNKKNRNGGEDLCIA